MNIVEARSVPFDLLNAFHDPEFLVIASLPRRPDLSLPWLRLTYPLPPNPYRVPYASSLWPMPLDDEVPSVTRSDCITLYRTDFGWRDWRWSYHVGLTGAGQVIFSAGETFQVR